jgi:hypothetical protein
MQRLPLKHGCGAEIRGQMGGTIMVSADGSTIGPPADMEYAVEPVGVAIMTPSP